MRMCVMPFVMAIMDFLMANIASPSPSIWRKIFCYGEYYLGWLRTYGGNCFHMAILFSREHYGDVCLFAKASNWRHLAARTMRRRSLSAKRANREAESGPCCSSVVKYWFNGSIAALMN